MGRQIGRGAALAGAPRPAEPTMGGRFAGGRRSWRSLWAPFGPCAGHPKEGHLGAQWVSNHHNVVGAPPKGAYGEGMLAARSLPVRLAGLAALGACLSATTPAVASAMAPGDSVAADGEDDGKGEAKKKRRPIIPYKAIETQAIMLGQLLPKPSFGFDGAFVFGTATFQFRLGAIVAGSPAFRLGTGKIANALGVVTGDICVARNVYKHQIRMCMGGQTGGMAHKWIGYERPGRRLTGWTAGTLKGDYRLAITERFGVMAGVGVIIPVVGPSFRAYDQFGAATPLVFPGPVAGTITLGTSFRI